jgi:hypothetical protein
MTTPQRTKFLCISGLAALAAIAISRNAYSAVPAATDERPGGSAAAETASELPAKPEDIFPYRIDRDRLRLTTGDEETAKEYYRDLAERLNFPGKQVPTLDGLLAYFGYTVLKAADVDRFAPHDLMNAKLLGERYAKAPAANEFAAGKWDVLAAGYFAPKTSDVSGRSNKISWRKMVRFKPRPGSPAEQNGLSAMYFLSVIYVQPADLDKNPFEFPSQSVQVMLVADPKNSRSKLAAAACWLIFSPSEGYKPTYSTTTSWDAADDALTKGLQPYYLPSTCQQCHGGDDRSKATPHFIDTDYSCDKVGPGEDFAESIGRSRWSPLFETGKDPNSGQYRAAFNVFRQLNAEIAEHNKAVNPKSLQSYGSGNWLRLHRTEAKPVAPLERAWQSDAEHWSDSRLVDRNLLPLLDHYCYRCHGTVRYNVFALKAKGINGEDLGVLSRANKMILKIKSGAMPQDRQLSDAQKNELIGWLERLKGESKSP